MTINMMTIEMMTIRMMTIKMMTMRQLLVVASNVDHIDSIMDYCSDIIMMPISLSFICIILTYGIILTYIILTCIILTCIILTCYWSTGIFDFHDLF